MGLTAARFGVAATLVVVAAPGWSYAQSSPAPSRQELNPAARSQLAPPPPDLFSAPGAGACPLAENPAALTIKSVNLQGLESVPADDLKAAYEPYLDKAGDASDLCKVRDAVADALFERGILARVEIPAQTINEGAVTLEVIEAHIVNVTVRGDPGPAGPAIERYARKLRGMAPFDVNRVQRYILLASDLPGLTVRASLRPNASGARGAVDLDLNVKRDPQELIVNAQNLQSRATGRWGGLARGDFNAMTRYGEQTSLVFYRTAFHNEQWVVQGVEEARFGGEGASVRASLAYGESHPGDTLSPLHLKSRSIVANVEAAYPLVRSRRKNASVAAGLELVDQDTRVGGGARLINDDLRTIYLRVDGDQTAYWGAHPIVLKASGGLRQGIEGFGSTKARDPLLSRAQARPGAWVAHAEGSVFTVITPRISAYAAVNLQYANRPLAAYQEYAVGSLTIGRGYDPAYISGDSAMAASVELRGAPFEPKPGLAVSPYAFFDVARVTNRDPGASAETVKSVGVGFQVPVRERWVLDVGYARPLDKRAVDLKRPAGRLLVNLTARFF